MTLVVLGAAAALVGLTAWFGWHVAAVLGGVAAVACGVAMDVGGDV